MYGMIHLLTAGICHDVDHVGIVKLLKRTLKEDGADVNAQSETGNTALTGGFEDVVEVTSHPGL